MSGNLWILTAAIALTGSDDARSVRDEVAVEECDVHLKDDVAVAAQEAGILTEINVREGNTIEEGDLLAKINDSKAQMAKLVAQAEHKVALAEAESDVSIRYSEKAAEVAWADHNLHALANTKQKNSTPLAEMMKLKLQAQKGDLEIEKAELERKVAKLTSEAKDAAVQAADDDIVRRRVTSPISGMVVEVAKQRGEWVNPGDMVARVLRLDKLRVSGELKIANVDPASVMGRPVRVVATRTGAKQEEFVGRVVFVDPRVTQSGTFHLLADVDNRQEGQVWLLHPGINNAQMFVQREPAHGSQARNGRKK
ncbi:MAG TPA: HlyD family efflux transporter periplasmic adaptor subunit [Pirellulales bacterium]|nr:HlyD family efflux transporter periplasmic adaptor subunit [Pirellulales bacterium]